MIDPQARASRPSRFSQRLLLVILLQKSKVEHLLHHRIARLEAYRSSIIPCLGHGKPRPDAFVYPCLHLTRVFH
jgi:hypothetical protein